MDPVIAPFVLLFLGSLGLDLGLFDRKDDSADDAAPVETSSDETAPLAEPGNFNTTLYADVLTGTEGDDSFSAEQEGALA